VLPLRYPWLWLTFGWLLVAGVCVGSLVPGTELPRFLLPDKLVHAGSYFLLMIWFSGLYQRKRHLAIAVALVALGLGLDLLQYLVATRNFDMFDVLANGAGVLTGLVLAWLALAGWCQRVERLLFA